MLATILHFNRMLKSVVVPSEAGNLALRTKKLPDSSSPPARRTDRLVGLFSILLSDPLRFASA